MVGQLSDGAAAPRAKNRHGVEFGFGAGVGDENLPLPCGQADSETWGVNQRRTHGRVMRPAFAAFEITAGQFSDCCG